MSTHIQDPNVLSLEESNRKRVLEDRIHDASMAPFRVGESLKLIKAEKLYRDEYINFNDYCDEKWGIRRTRVIQLITAFDILQNLQGCTQLPTNERQVRPLMQLGGPLQKETWEKCITEYPEGDVTGSIIQKYVDKIVPPESKKSRSADIIITDQSDKAAEAEPVEKEPAPVETEITKDDVLREVLKLKQTILSIKKQNYKVFSKEKIAGLLKTLLDVIRNDEDVK